MIKKWPPEHVLFVLNILLKFLVSEDYLYVKNLRESYKVSNVCSNV